MKIDVNNFEFKEFRKYTNTYRFYLEKPMKIVIETAFSKHANNWKFQQS